MQIEDYLQRIDYVGPVEPTLECLCGVHRQHLLKIPYENLDIQLGRLLDLNLQHIFEKIVGRNRGGNVQVWSDRWEFNFLAKDQGTKYIRINSIPLTFTKTGQYSLQVMQ